MLTSKTMTERLRDALRDCVNYIELDSERPHFLFGAKALLAEASDKTNARPRSGAWCAEHGSSWKVGCPSCEGAIAARVGDCVTFL
jgi:hypothetical protein